jgi:Uma2 family endonuclease
MSHEPETRMTREEYRAWAEQQVTGRFERIEGVVIAMAPERLGHIRRKRSAVEALRAAVQRSGLPCEVFADGVTVEVGDSITSPTPSSVAAGTGCQTTLSLCATLW